jgi:hypothetical protein
MGELIMEKAGWPHERYGPAPVPIVAGKDGVKLPEETSIALTELHARRYVEQGEPAMHGTWYLIPLHALSAEGFDAIEVHYPDSEDALAPPDAIVLHKGALS